LFSPNFSGEWFCHPRYYYSNEADAENRCVLSLLEFHCEYQTQDRHRENGIVGHELHVRQFEKLSSLAFIERKENLILMGPSGKSHLMWLSATRPVWRDSRPTTPPVSTSSRTLVLARENNRLKRRLVWLRKPHLLLIDEVGYEKLTPEQANLFFQVVNARYVQGSMIITTNKPFGRWAEIVMRQTPARLWTGFFTMLIS